MWLLYSVLALLIWTFVNSFFMKKLKQPNNNGPLVSILVPLRNEEGNVRKLINSLRNVSYKNVRFFLLNDHSTDATADLLYTLSEGDSRFRILEGGELLEGWVGKVNACRQLSVYAEGDYFLFLDADVEIEPNFIGRVVATMEQQRLDLLTGFPRFKVRNVLSILAVPMLHFLVYVHLPLWFANYTKWVSTTAANGMVMCFRATAYKAVGGHSVVKDSLIEDVAFAKVMKRRAFKVGLTRISPYATCEMYTTNRDTWEGFVKNSFVGVGRSVLMVVGVSVFYVVIYIFPIIAFIVTLNPMYFLIYLLSVLQRAWVDVRANQRNLYAVLMPLSAFILVAILWTSMWRSLTNKPYIWKGREYK